MIRIVIDSTGDMPTDMRNAHQIGVVPVLLIRGNETLRDEIDISRTSFYEWLATTDKLPGTSAPSVGLYLEAFRPLAVAGHEILSISLAGNLSGTYSAACQAAEVLRGEVPGVRIECVDSGSIAMPLSFLAEAAADMAGAGQSLEQIVANITDLRKHLRVLVALDTLRYLEMGGRISKMRAWIGSALSVKPVLEVRDGELRSIEQVRSWKRIPGRLIELARERGQYQRLSVQYTSDHAAAADLADQCAAAGLLARDQIRVVQVGAVLGTHVGPGALAITGMVQG